MDESLKTPKKISIHSRFLNDNVERTHLGSSSIREKKFRLDMSWSVFLGTV